MKPEAPEVAGDVDWLLEEMKVSFVQGLGLSFTCGRQDLGWGTDHSGHTHLGSW